MKKFILPLWIFASICLLLYSFTQVDLSLTLSRASIYQTVEQWFQYVGWFNRPLSTVFYILIIGLLFVLYITTLNLIKKGILEWKNVWSIIIVVSIILFLSYNAFSYDLFNYIFDAKILVHYNQNPYLFKALDFPNDPMLSFMRWTHRTYPYGPVWMGLTAPLYFLGFGIFSFTFYLFKLLMAASFVGSVVFLRKIAKRLDVNPTFAVAAFALNPLVLVESLVSAHNDIVMMFFGLVGLYLFLEKKYSGSAVSVLASVLIKFATIFMIPAMLLKSILKLNSEAFLKILTLSMIGAVIVAVLSRSNFNPQVLDIQFQPWYLLYVLPFAALIAQKKYVLVPITVISLAGLLQYIPYLFLGNWDPPVPVILNGIMIVSVIASLLIGIGIKPQRDRV